MALKRINKVGQSFFLLLIEWETPYLALFSVIVKRPRRGRSNAIRRNLDKIRWKNVQFSWRNEDSRLVIF